MLGEIRMFAGAGIIPGCALCNGAILDTVGNEGLAGLIAFNTQLPQFALPDYQARTLVHGTVGVDQVGGNEEVTLAVPELPAHRHNVNTNSTGATTADPTGAVLAVGCSYAQQVPTTSLDRTALSSTGGGNPHENRQPYTVVSFQICVAGDVPV